MTFILAKLSIILAELYNEWFLTHLNFLLNNF